LRIKEVMSRKKISDEKLYKELVSLLGPRKVSNKLVDLISYSHDYWPISLLWFLKGEIPSLPSIVVFPESLRDVVKVVRYAYDNEIPLYAYGGGTGVLGGAVPEYGGIVIDLKRLRHIKLYEEDLYVDVGAGTNGMILENYLNKKGYTLGHFPQSLYSSTVGGWISTKAIGQFSTKYGGIEDMLLGLEVVVPPGEVIHIKPNPRAAVGPDIKHLFIEAEGMFGIITRAYLKIHPYPEKRVLLSFASKSLADALESVQNILRRGAKPAVVRIYDKVETLKWFHMKKKAKGKIGTIIILEGDNVLVEAERKIVEEEFRNAESMGEEPVRYWLEKRFDVRELPEYAPLGIVIDTIEVAVPWSRAVDLYNDVINAMRDIEGTLIAYAHASHFYPQGVCFYFIFGGIPPKGISATEYYEKIWEAAMNATLKHEGAISHHHGIGRMRAKWIRKDLGDATMELLRKMKNAIDEKRILNRGNMGV